MGTKRTIKITQQRLSNIISEAIESTLKEGCHSLNYYEMSSDVPSEALLEMARLNVENDSKSPFPSDIYDLRMWSNDHSLIHFHITNKQDGWEVTSSLEGKVLSIKKKSTSLNIKKVEELCKEWLSGSNKYGFNNKQYAKSIWDSIHN